MYQPQICLSISTVQNKLYKSQNKSPSALTVDSCTHVSKSSTKELPNISKIQWYQRNAHSRENTKCIHRWYKTDTYTRDQRISRIYSVDCRKWRLKQITETNTERHMYSYYLYFFYEYYSYENSAEMRHICPEMSMSWEDETVTELLTTNQNISIQRSSDLYFYLYLP